MLSQPSSTAAGMMGLRTCARAGASQPVRFPYPQSAALLLPTRPTASGRLEPMRLGNPARLLPGRPARNPGSAGRDSFPSDPGTHLQLPQRAFRYRKALWHLLDPSLEGPTAQCCLTFPLLQAYSGSSSKKTFSYLPNFVPLSREQMRALEERTLPIVRQGLYFRRWDLGA